jgi:NADH-ubiquinone oxidoreductase chain 4
MNRREFYVLAPLVVLTLILGMWPNVVLDLVHTSVVSLLVTFGAA